MKCPYCNTPMILGYLQSSRMLVWDTEKLSGLILPSKDGIGRTLTKRFSKTHAIEAFFCEECKLLLSRLNT